MLEFFEFTSEIAWSLALHVNFASVNGIKFQLFVVPQL